MKVFAADLGRRIACHGRYKLALLIVLPTLFCLGYFTAPSIWLRLTIMLSSSREATPPVAPRIRLRLTQVRSLMKESTPKPTDDISLSATWVLLGVPSGNESTMEPSASVQPISCPNSNTDGPERLENQLPLVEAEDLEAVIEAVGEDVEGRPAGSVVDTAEHGVPAVLVNQTVPIVVESVGPVLVDLAIAVVVHDLAGDREARGTDEDRRPVELEEAFELDGVARLSGIDGGLDRGTVDGDVVLT